MCTDTCPTQLHTYKWVSDVCCHSGLCYWPWASGIRFAQKVYSTQQVHPPSSPRMDDLAMWARWLHRHGRVYECCPRCRPEWESGFALTALCLSVAAGERLVGILLLYLPGVPGPESGVPSDAGGDHQWPAAKGGVRECQDPLLSQEVTGDVSQEELCLKFPRVVPHPWRTQEKSYFWHTWWFIPLVQQFLKLKIMSRVGRRAGRVTWLWRDLHSLEGSSFSNPQRLETCSCSSGWKAISSQ